MKISIRCNALDRSQLAAQEKHGKRLDEASKKRIITKKSPLVYRTMDLMDAQSLHVDGASQNSSARKCALHFILRFPPEVLDEKEVGRFKGSRDDRKKMMLRQAITFIEKTHGGNAVFAARVDRDEAGETIVDVFASPRYEKVTREGKKDEKRTDWTSLTKFGKDLAKKHEAEIVRRNTKKGTNLTGPRQVGIALNSEFRDFFETVNNVKLSAKKEKTGIAPDRLEIEAYKEIADSRAELKKIEEDLDRRETQLEKLRERVLGLVQALGAVMGFPLPRKISKAVDLIEREIAAASAADDRSQEKIDQDIKNDDERFEL